ncbi:MAG TPA: AraC family transcriptional regulator [Rhodocyclaceae bacterium]|nr:AraC family transcriptional regulator [Rhodocyclaceae bacterium]
MPSRKPAIEQSQSGISCGAAAKCRPRGEQTDVSKENAYALRFRRVFDYIDKHLDEALPLEVLSEVANFSKFHFHRQFSEHTGISVFRYVQLMRLKRASYRLAFNRLDKIIDIAMEAGFENPESFSRAFKSIFGQTPSAFRKAPEWAEWNEHYKLPSGERKHIVEVKIVDFEETKVAVLEHRGPPELINNTVSVFIAWRKETGLSPASTARSFGIAYDNPETTEPAKFRFDLCGTVNADVPENAYGISNKSIPAGRCAVVRHLGSHARIAESIYPLYRDWLPQSGEELRDFPLYFNYLNLMPATPEHELVTDIYLPLK